MESFSKLLKKRFVKYGYTRKTLTNKISIPMHKIMKNVIVAILVGTLLTTQAFANCPKPAMKVVQGAIELNDLSALTLSVRVPEERILK